jgi:hypothetical protein
MNESRYFKSIHKISIANAKNRTRNFRRKARSWQTIRIYKSKHSFQEWLQLARLNQLKEKRKEVVSPENKKLELLISL